MENQAKKIPPDTELLWTVVLWISKRNVWSNTGKIIARLFCFQCLKQCQENGLVSVSTDLFSKVAWAEYYLSYFCVCLKILHSVLLLENTVDESLYGVGESKRLVVTTCFLKRSKSRVLGLQQGFTFSVKKF